MGNAVIKHKNMSFNKNKAYEIFQVDFSEEENSQVNELKETAKDFARRNATNSGMYFKAHTDLYKKHLKIRVDYFINALLKLFRDDEIIKEKVENELIKELSAHIDIFYKYKSDSLKSVMASIGFNKTGILSAQLSALQSGFNEIKSIKTKYLKQLIENHNNIAQEKKKSKSFWNTKSGMIVAICTVVIMLFTILNSFGVFQKGTSENIPIIHSFDVSLQEISKGQSVNILWDVENADSVLLNNNFGKVSLSGSKIIYPSNSTVITLSAFLDNKILSITKKVIVKDSLGNAL